VLPYNRIVIIAFALFVVLTWLLLNKTPGPQRARRDPEPQHGRLLRRAHRRVDMLALASAPASPGLAAWR
jgi:hypothetical protein